MRDNKTMKNEPHVGQPIVSGIFYPEEKADLKQLVLELLDQSETEEKKTSTPTSRQTRVLIVPHASYRHVGAYIARAFCHLSHAENITQVFKRVVLLSTVHHNFEEAVWLPEYGSFQCPLGQIPVDTEMVRSIADKGAPFQIKNLPYTEEHSQEIVLPFLAHCAPEVPIIPFMLGNNSQQLVLRTAQLLKHMEIVHEPSTLFIISTNLSSFTDSVNAQREAEYFLSQLETPSPDFLSSRYSKACGRGGLQLLHELFYTPIDYIKLGVGRSGIIQPEQREVWYGSFAGRLPIETKPLQEEKL